MSLFYAAATAIAATGLFTAGIRRGERLYYLSLLQSFLLLPFLALQYLLLSLQPAAYPSLPLLYTELIIACVWLGSAYWLHAALEAKPLISRTAVSISVGVSLFLVAAGIRESFLPPRYMLDARHLAFFPAAFFTTTNILLLIALALMACRLEGFWRRLSPKQRWEYKYLVAGKYLFCATAGWAVSYRMMYTRMDMEQCRLLVALYTMAWAMILFAVLRHRLLNRKFYVSRKVVYAFVAPMAFGSYLILIGLMVLFMRIMDIEFPVVLRWFLIIAGGTGVALLAVSGRIRHSVKYFVSTHFYVNKYEYRDEWLSFSRLLQDAESEAEVIAALEHVLSKSLYTNAVYIWVDSGDGMYLPAGGCHRGEEERALPADHGLIQYLGAHGIWREQAEKSRAAFPDILHPVSAAPDSAAGLSLAVPLSLGDRILGVIGLGREFTGGQYGEDDYDLLTAIGTQAASALMAVRMAEKVAEMRRQEAWDVMSAFILHDVKNAASMLSLIRQNAPRHLHDPEFQEDMLETIDDALRRMGKVQGRLSALRREIIPENEPVRIAEFADTVVRRMERRLAGLYMQVLPEEDAVLTTDPELLSRIFENLMINALEAGGKGTRLFIRIRRVEENGQQKLELGFRDDGPGIASDLLPDAIFEPFQTTKENGSGVGLWQVKRLVSLLGGGIRVSAGTSDFPDEGKPVSGAEFLLRFPVTPTAPPAETGKRQFHRRLKPAVASRSGKYVAKTDTSGNNST
ncbi:PEP-CTERM system histidine kinase PrsK [bacterium DOLZORAL124_64_63]|nr:MAG: PEP-CTERM system histidine kinase PrsK [bacterium DOLZORAL124_64_63]